MTDRKRFQIPNFAQQSNLFVASYSLIRVWLHENVQICEKHPKIFFVCKYFRSLPDRLPGACRILDHRSCRCALCPSGLPVAAGPRNPLACHLKMIDGGESNHCHCQETPPEKINTPIRTATIFFTYMCISWQLAVIRRSCPSTLYIMLNLASDERLPIDGSDWQ